MNMVIAWSALVMSFLVLGSTGPSYSFVASPVFLASAAAGFGLFENRSKRLLLLTSAIGGLGALASAIAMCFTTESALERTLTSLVGAGFMCTMLFSLKLHELSKKQETAYQKSRSDLKNADEPQFEPLESEQTTNTS